jgi:hypothetical protein
MEEGSDAQLDDGSDPAVPGGGPEPDGLSVRRDVEDSVEYHLWVDGSLDQWFAGQRVEPSRTLPPIQSMTGERGAVTEKGRL